jgi:putative transcriptional regulator
MRDDPRMASPLAGTLLISAPSLWDPNFRRTVVLIGHHDDDGAVGVVLNAVTDVPVAQAAPPLAPLVPEGEPVFLGGPVQPQGAVVLADLEHPERLEVVALGSIGFLPEDIDPEELGPIRRARVFAGHAGWGPGQLEAELEEGSWLLEPAVPDDVFHPEPSRLWEDVLGRKGRGFEVLRLMPEDPSTN